MTAHIIKAGRVSSKQNMLPVAGVLSGALVWGLVWYPYRVLQSSGISGAMSTMITYLLAMLVGAILFRGAWPESAAFGVWESLLILSSGWSNFGYVVAMLHGEVMRVLLLFYMAPLWTIIFSFWLLGERLNLYGSFVIGLSLIGATIMLWRPGVGFPLPQNLSEWLGLSAGISFALANVISRRTVNLSIEAKSLIVWFGAALLTFPFILFQGNMVGQVLVIDKQSWLILGVMSITLLATSYVVQYGVTHLPANQAAVLFLFELVVAAVSSFFLAGEKMGWQEWTGAMPIVLASLLSGKLYLDKSMS